MVSDLIFCRGARNCTAGEGQFPFMVSFVYTHRRSIENFCGGALISTRHVLSAAHCFSNIQDGDWASGKVDVRIGQNDITHREAEGSRANIARITVSLALLLSHLRPHYLSLDPPELQGKVWHPGQSYP